MVVQGSPFYDRFGGIHDTYGNAMGMRGYPSGRYADGSTFVFDIHHETFEKGYVEPTTRRQVDVMVKHGGIWRYFEFAGDCHTKRSVTVAQGEAQCAACHNLARPDHVFRNEDPPPAIGLTP